MSVVVSKEWGTLLHVVAGTDQVHFVDLLVKLLNPNDLELQNFNRNMAFCYSAASGNLYIASLMIKKNAGLPKIQGSGGYSYLYEPLWWVGMITTLVITVTFILIFHFIPLYGQTHIMVYIGVYSLIGSITVMSVKALGIVIKLTMSGMNQLIYPQTWAFSLVVIAVDTFNAAVVSPIYYVMFTAFTIVASVIMFKGFIAYALNYGLITW
eukprot:XP_014625982.1 probable magnesium transporter NIPA4 [Glycine max]